MSSSPGLPTSLPSIPTSSPASAIASRSPAPKTIGATLRSWRPPLPPGGREVGGKGGRQDLSVAPIVFGAGDREAIAEAGELVGIEGKEVGSPGEEDIDNRPARHLQRDSHGLDGAGGQLRQPVGKALKRRSLMAHLALPHDPALGIQHHNAMLLSRPVDPDVEAVDGSTHRSPFLRAAEPQRRIAPCTGAHSAIPHRMGTVAGLPRDRESTRL